MLESLVITAPPSLHNTVHHFCENSTQVHADSNPAISTLMFAMGVLGNLLALGILGVHRRERRARASPFCILVTGLAVTDLLGTCVLSPVVFVSYAKQASLLALGSEPLCKLFAFAMTFFNLSSMMILFFMAFERCLALSHPYVYAQHSWGHRLARASLPISYVLPALLCALPLIGVGEHKQYCPGTWCFIRMAVPPTTGKDGALAFSLLYASLTGLLILAIFTVQCLCDCQPVPYEEGAEGEKRLTAQRGRHPRVVPGSRRRGAGTSHPPGAHDLNIHGLRAFLGALYNKGDPMDETGDLMAFRFSALNPILDPWIFIIFRGSVFRKLQSLLCTAWNKPTKPVPALGSVEAGAISPMTSITGP
ncbi:unnamed protein product [Ranitomeya imitator]|uniref:G-protein coupled receptors family 1 profile domain-containing protein n=1 Tax=Ranitomeya imitator TaxID=111125 RepID=A0ABN9MKF1_9NEOB|nr:unnamed protein product [Ranitomeya imitator]